MIKKGIIFILNFALIICIVALSSILILSNTVLSKQYMLSMLEKNNYYERVYYDIQDGFKNYIMQSGLDESILENLYDRNKVKKDIDAVIDAVYENKNLNLDTDTIRATLENRINSVLTENNKMPDEEEKEAIKIFEDAIVETYANGIAYSQKYVGQIGSIFAKIQGIVSLAKYGIIAVIVVLVIMIMAINRSVRESAKTIGIALLSSGVLAILLKLLLGTRLHNILILNAIFSETLVYLLRAVVDTFFNVGVVIAVIGVLAIVLGCINKREDDGTQSRVPE